MKKIPFKTWELIRRGIIVVPINTRETFYKHDTAMKCR